MLLAMAMFVSSGAVAIRGLAMSRSLQQQSYLTKEVLLNLADLQLALDRLELSSRDFALMGKETVLDSDRDTVSRVQRDALAIHTWVAEGSWLSARLPPLEVLIAQEIQAVAMIAQLRRSEG